MKNRVKLTFKMKLEYCLELLLPETANIWKHRRNMKLKKR